MLLSFILNLLAKLIIKLYEFLKKLVIEEINRGGFMKWQDFLFAALMCFGLVLSIWKLPYGFGGSDEAFYLMSRKQVYITYRKMVADMSEE